MRWAFVASPLAAAAFACTTFGSDDPSPGPGSDASSPPLDDAGAEAATEAAVDAGPRSVQLYVIGGSTPGGDTADILAAPVGQDGLLGDWELVGTLSNRSGDRPRRRPVTAW